MRNRDSRRLLATAYEKVVRRRSRWGGYTALTRRRSGFTRRKYENSSAAVWPFALPRRASTGTRSCPIELVRWTVFVKFDSGPFPDDIRIEVATTRREDSSVFVSNVAIGIMPGEVGEIP